MFGKRCGPARSEHVKVTDCVRCEKLLIVKECLPHQPAINWYHRRRSRGNAKSAKDRVVAQTVGQYGCIDDCCSRFPTGNYCERLLHSIASQHVKDIDSIV